MQEAAENSQPIHGNSLEGLTPQMGLQEGITSPFGKEGLPESMLLESESLWLPVPIHVNPGGDWPVED